MHSMCDKMSFLRASLKKKNKNQKKGRMTLPKKQAKIWIQELKVSIGKEMNFSQITFL